MSDNQFAVAVLVPTLGIAGLILWFGPSAMSAACAVAAAEHGPAGCLEFWLNRYQTFFAGTLALAAAAIAVLPVYHQLREMTRQSAAAAIPNLRIVAAEIEEELSFMKKTDRSLEKIPSLVEFYDDHNPHELPDNWVDGLRQLGQTSFEAWQFLSNREDRDSTQPDLNRCDGIHALHNLINATADFDYAIKEQTSGPNYEDGEGDLTVEETAQRRTAMDDTHKAWVEWYTAYVPIGLRLRREAWVHVRAMERAASLN